MKKLLKFKGIIALVLVLFLGSTRLYAQIDPLPTNPGCAPDCPEAGPSVCPPGCVPIDGGVVFLIVAAVGIAAKKAYDSKVTHAVSII